MLDAAGAERAVVVSWCGGAGVLLAAEHPDRVEALVEVATDLPVTIDPIEAAGFSFDDELDTVDGWAKWNRHYWCRDWPGFVEFFIGRMFSEPHSTKQIEDAVGWGLEAEPEVIVRATDAEWIPRDEALELCSQVRCPALVIQGTGDRIVGPERGPRIAAAIPGARLVLLEGSGHAPHARDPVRFNLELDEFLGGARPAVRSLDAVA